MDFRTRLREQIEYAGLLDKEVAERAGITKHAMDTYVGSRACMPAADIAVRLAKVLGVSVEYLVTGEKSESPQNSKRTAIQEILSDLESLDKTQLLFLKKMIHALV